MAIQEKGGAGGEGGDERGVLDEDDGTDPAARAQPPGFVASARREHDEADEVYDLKERVDQGGRFRSSLR